MEDWPSEWPNETYENYETKIDDTLDGEPGDQVMFDPIPEYPDMEYDEEEFATPQPDWNASEEYHEEPTDEIDELSQVVEALTVTSRRLADLTKSRGYFQPKGKGKGSGKSSGKTSPKGKGKNKGKSIRAKARVL